MSYLTEPTDGEAGRDLEEELEGVLARFTIDRDFLSRHVEGFRTLASSLRNTAWCVDVAVSQVRDSIDLSASIYTKTKMISQNADTSKACDRHRLNNEKK